MEVRLSAHTVRCISSCAECECIMGDEAFRDTRMGYTGESSHHRNVQTSDGLGAKVGLLPSELEASLAT